MKINNFIQLLKPYFLIIAFVLILFFLLFFGIGFEPIKRIFTDTQIGGDKITADLKLESLKYQVIDSKEIDEIVCDPLGKECVDNGKIRKYYYPGENLSIKPMAEIVGESKKGFSKTKEDYAYVTYSDGKESITRFYDTRSRVKGGDTGQFYDYEWATTTLEKWDKSMSATTTPKISLKEKIKNLFGNNALATDSTFYPDPNAETTSVDGWVGRNPATAATFSDCRDGVGTEKNDSDDIYVYVFTTNTTDKFDAIRAGVFIFDTSTIPDDDTINSAIISFVGAKVNQIGSPDFHVASTTSASNTALANGDYELRGRTSFGSIAYASFTGDEATYNNITLSAAGLTNISKTGVSKFSGQTSWDINNTAPTWVSAQSAGFYILSAERTGTSKDPKLVVTHTSGATPTPERRKSNNSQMLIY